MAELTDQEMNDHMDEYEEVSVFPKTTRCDQDHVQNHEKFQLCMWTPSWSHLVHYILSLELLGLAIH